MLGDQWHNGKFTVVPKVDENKGLNFLDCSAEEYLDVIRDYLREKGQKPDKPLAFLCNPPYRSDDDQAADAINYKIHDSIVALTGKDASSERYCCFLAQMKLICQAAKSNGFPDNTLLLIFTKSAWLTRRKVFAKIRAEMLGAFEEVAGVLVNSSEFFDVKGRWPLAFSVWRYKEKGAKLDHNRSIPFLDLTWLSRKQLLQVPWNEQREMEIACQNIIDDSRAACVEIGAERTSIMEWSGETRKDFLRNKCKSELNQAVVGGLPSGDPRHGNKKAQGRTHGTFIGFMDELTPCRVEKSTPDRPWFYLDTRFMRVKTARCLSGPPSNRGYCAVNLDASKKLFFWYAMARTLLQHPYPMWVDQDNMWEPNMSAKLEQRLFQIAFAIGYAENECVETKFPANNPVNGLLELTIRNPMTPLYSDSFWSKTMRPYCAANPSETALTLTKAVDKLFDGWKKLFNGHTSLPLSRRSYMLDDEGLKLGAGIAQIKDYAKETENEALASDWSAIQKLLTSAKSEFFELVTSKSGLSYFGYGTKLATKTVKFHRTAAEVPGPKKS
jgi:hypothetical protein